MHRRIGQVLAVVFCFFVSTPLGAAQELLTFDEVVITNQSSMVVPRGYAGVRWTSLFVTDTLRSSEFRRAAISTNNVIQTMAPGEALVYSGHPFDLEAAWVTSASTSPSQFNVVAMFGPISLYTNTFIVSGGTATCLNFGMRNVTGVRLFMSERYRFALDNVTMTPPERELALPGWFKPGAVFFPITNVLAVAAGDLNHDGHTELVMTSRGGTTIALNDQNGGFTLRETTAARGNFIAVGDFTGDGREDAVISTAPSQFSQQAVTRLIQFTNFVSFTTNGISNVFGLVAVGDFGMTNRLLQTQGATDVLPADLNGDGYLDYVKLTQVEPRPVVATNRGNGTFAQEVSVGTAFGLSSLAVGDFDLDGDVDFATANPLAGTITVFYNTGLATFPRWTNFPSGLARPIAVAAADLDGDHLPEIVTRSVFSGLSILRGLGGGRFGAPMVITHGAGYPTTNLFPRSIALRDLNSDGAPDIAFISGTEVATLLNIFPPRVGIARIEDLIEVFWPTNFAKGAVIEYTTEIGPEAVWTTDTFPPFDIGAYRAIFDAGDAPQMFFRLRRSE